MYIILKMESEKVAKGRFIKRKVEIIIRDRKSKVYNNRRQLIYFIYFLKNGSA